MKIEEIIMIKIGINGLGRIGRAIFRIIDLFDDLEVVAINDVNPEIANIVYLIKYDSYYGRFKYNIKHDDKFIYFNGGTKIKVFREKDISEVNWASAGCDVVIESSGVHGNLAKLPELIYAGIKKVVVTYAPSEIDNTILLGANENDYDPDNHHIISSSICDVVAFAPVYKLINDTFGVKSGFLKTLHPWLSYQNLLDGPSFSWNMPGKLYHHYVLGRASTASIIPKPTTAIQAADKIFPGIIEKMRCYSFRIPTPVVGAADITFQLASKVRINDLLDTIHQYERKQRWPILYLNSEPLVSVDFTGTDYSAIIDNRWIEIINGELLNLTLWYDNEWGYSRRVVDVVRHVMELEPQKEIHEECTLS